ncbi:hypothetical protein Tco_0968414 [Tanacetum coccineum]
MPLQPSRYWICRELVCLFATTKPSMPIFNIRDPRDYNASERCFYLYPRIPFAASQPHCFFRNALTCAGRHGNGKSGSITSQRRIVENNYKREDTLEVNDWVVGLVGETLGVTLLAGGVDGLGDTHVRNGEESETTHVDMLEGLRGEGAQIIEYDSSTGTSLMISEIDTSGCGSSDVEAGEAVGDTCELDGGWLESWCMVGTDTLDELMDIGGCGVVLWTIFYCDPSSCVFSLVSEKSTKRQCDTVSLGVEIWLSGDGVEHRGFFGGEDRLDDSSVSRSWGMDRLDMRHNNGCGRDREIEVVRHIFEGRYRVGQIELSEIRISRGRDTLSSGETADDIGMERGIAGKWSKREHGVVGSAHDRTGRYS